MQSAREVEEVRERAQVAFLAANRRKREWQALARAFSRQPRLNLKFTHGTSCTDGKDVFIRVPLELAEDVRHDASCGERDADKVLTCPKCRLTETVDIVVIHEVAHIVCDTFAPVSTDHVAKYVAESVRRNLISNPTSKRAQTLDARVTEALALGKGLMPVAAQISKFMPSLYNSCEDIRVNNLMMQTRPGTRTMFAARLALLSREGTLLADGSRMFWRDAPENFQATMAVYLLMSDLDLKGKLKDEIIERLDDEEFYKIVDKMRDAKDQRVLFSLVFPLLEALRRLGFMLDDDDPQDDPEDSSEESSESGDESEQSEEGSDSDQSGSESQASDDRQDDSSDDEDSSGENESDSASEESRQESDSGTGDSDTSLDEGEDESASGGGEDEDEEGSEPKEDPAGSPEKLEELLKASTMHGDPAHKHPTEKLNEDEAIELAINQAEWFQSPSKNIEEVHFYKWDDPKRGPAWSKSMAERYRIKIEPLEVENRILVNSLSILRRVFTDNARGSKATDLRKGKVNPRSIASRIPTKDDRLFMRKTEPGKKDYFVLIGLDVSGSTYAGMADGRERIQLIKEAAYAKAEMLNRLGINFAVYAHTGDSMSLDIYEIKSPHQKWNATAREALSSLVPFSANLDGHSLEFYRKIVEARSETDRMILYYTDGKMPAENYDEELEILQREIKTCEKLGIKLVGVGINTEAPVDHGLDTIRLDVMEDVPKVVNGLRDRLRSA